MKKFLIISAIIISIPAFGMCDIDNSSVCTLPQIRKNYQPIYSKKTNVSEFSSNPESRLQPLKRDNLEESIQPNSFGESDHSYNTSCQFGICLQNRKTPNFQQKKQ